MKDKTYKINMKKNSNCWNCDAYLDIEEKRFDNQCPYCGFSQGWDKENNTQW